MMKKLILHVHEHHWVAAGKSILTCHNMPSLFAASSHRTSPWWSIAQWNSYPRRTSGTWRQVASPCSDGATAGQDYLQLTTFVLPGLVKPRSFATEMNSSTENAPQEGTTCGLCSCSSDTLRGREVLEANQPALSLQGERRQASETGKNLKGEWTSRTTTGASNNCIHLLVLATSHCLSLKKIAVFWIRKILQCKLSICYFSILLLAV